MMQSERLEIGKQDMYILLHFRDSSYQAVYQQSVFFNSVENSFYWFLSKIFSIENG